MDPHNQAQNKVYSEEDKKITQMRLQKKKRKMLVSIALICLLLIFSLSIGVGMISKNARRFYDNNISTDPPKANTDKIQLSIYPDAWESMNAVIVKWGEQNEQTWTETSGQYAHYDRQNFTIEYVGVNVEFVKIYSNTMKKSHIADIETIIRQTEYLMIPEYHLEQINVGDTALVFLDDIAHIAVVDSDGRHDGTETTILGVRVGDCIAQDKFVPAPIFNITDGKVIIENEAYEINPKNGEYYMFIITLLHNANEYIRKKNVKTEVAFENGISVEKLTDLFTYVCGEN